MNMASHYQFTPPAPGNVKRLARWLLVTTLSTMLLLLLALVLLESRLPVSGARGEWLYGVLVVSTVDGARLLGVLALITVVVFALRWWRTHGSSAPPPGQR